MSTIIKTSINIKKIIRLKNLLFMLNNDELKFRKFIL